MICWKRYIIIPSIFSMLPNTQPNRDFYEESLSATKKTAIDYRLFLYNFLEKYFVLYCISCC